MSKDKEQFKKIVTAILIGTIVFALSISIFSVTQATLLGLIAFLVTLWTNEGLPLGVVSLLPIVLFPSFSILSTTQTTESYSNPIVFLFFGGFLIAIAVEKTELHKWITQKMFAVFPSTPKGIIFSLAITSGLLSSLLSNTTTTLLLMPIAVFIADDIRLKMRFVLAIAYGASVGGILTPIGTPPNLILLGFMQDKNMELISFLEWIFLAAPLVFIMFFVVASLLSIGVKDIAILLKSEKKALNFEQKKVLLLIGGVVLLLLFNAPLKPYWSGLGLNENIILLGAGLLLFAPPFGILDWTSDKEKIPFAIMLLFGAGFSIATAFSASGLADELASYLIAMMHLPPILIILGIATLITFATGITSNTALISVMLPIIYSVAQQSGIDAVLFMMVATVCSSYAFMLPIATPPNAIAMSSGAVSVAQMVRYGVVLNFAGIFLVTIIAEFFWKGF
ncbi:MAG: DASS family sodium-coupled anion symporter [Sulfurimonas sp.]